MYRHLLILFIPLFLCCSPKKSGGGKSIHYEDVVFFDLIKEKSGDYYDAFSSFSGSVTSLYTYGKNILVSDRYNPSVWNINIKSIVDKKFVFGKGPGEFINGPGKISYNKKNKNIAIQDIGTFKIKLFDESLNFIKDVNFPFPPFDFDFNNEGELYVSLPIIKNMRGGIFRLNNEGELIEILQPQNIDENPLKNIYFIDIDLNNNIYILTNMFSNGIETCNKSMKSLGTFFMPTVSNSLKTQKLPSNKLFTEIPVGKIITDICFDSSGTLYVLSGDKSLNPHRDVFVYNSRGKLLKIFILEEEAKHICVLNEKIIVGNDHEIFVYKMR